MVQEDRLIILQILKANHLQNLKDISASMILSLLLRSPNSKKKNPQANICYFIKKNLVYSVKTVGLMVHIKRKTINQNLQKISETQALIQRAK
jgi:hypothetical protein